MSILQANIDFLARKFPHVIQSITNAKVDYSKVYTERLEKDMAWLEAVEGSVEDFKLIFMYGFGQGLALIDLLEKYPDRWIFVYEPNITVFYDTIEKYNFVELFQKPGFKGLAIGEDSLKMLFSSILSYMESDLAFVAHRHYLEQEADQLYELKNQFLKYSELFEVNQQTMDHFRMRWMRNSMFQLADMLKSQWIENVRNTLPDCTVIVVGSGPSLQQDIEILRKMKDHAIVIAAGSSIQALVKHGIQPHLTVAMDGGVVNERIFATSDVLVAPLLITSTAYYGMSEKQVSGRMYSILRNDTVAHYCLGQSKDHFAIEPTSTVTGTAMQAAICLGAKKIIMMGQDLSFQNNKFYTDGILHADADYLEEKIETANTSNWLVENVNGSQNVTNQSFLFMKEGIEELIAAFPKVEFINATRNGAKINGSVFIPAEEVLQSIEHTSVDQHAVKNVLDQHPALKNESKIEEVKNRLEATKQDFKHAQQQLKNIQKMLGKLQVLSRTKPLKAQQLLEEIERTWGAVSNRLWFEAIIESIIPLQLSRFDKQLPSIVTDANIVTKSSLIYVHLGELIQSILETLDYTDEIFEASLEQINHMNTL
ncbi:motility associated factor glycosyltransferase family protein [Paenibacillus campi]|uniref:motility associated factor glycosyltransferase family protein n=1 Tax=Paenibacillus campi TaxID=3106031 RepID=UPI002AFF16A9|nr:6-hydroxymethylpterin diphosphokinase MptE-like protein [Paenibacillus sp. SGZ-1014]